MWAFLQCKNEKGTQYTITLHTLNRDVCYYSPLKDFHILKYNLLKFRDILKEHIPAFNNIPSLLPQLFFVAK